MSAKDKSNIGFGPFIRAGVATPGFQAVNPAIVERMQCDNLTYEEIRYALIHDYGWDDRDQKWCSANCHVA